MSVNDDRLAVGWMRGRSGGHI